MTTKEDIILTLEAKSSQVSVLGCFALFGSTHGMDG